MPPPRYSVILGNLGNTCDRFLPTGYKEKRPSEEMILQAAAIPGIEGLELVGNWDVTFDNHRAVLSLMERGHLKCASIIPDHFSQRRWGKGAFCCRDSGVRREAAEETVQAARIAEVMGCPLINLWLGQDGYDYSLQAHFGRERGWMVEGIGQAASRFPSLRFALEYKLKEPRTHSYHARAADTLLMAQEIGLPNVGVCIDVGHALMAYENVAEAAWLLQHYGKKLFHLHFNDNYRYWDDDMIVGSVHFVEYVELLFWLRETQYDGWYSMDQYPYREDGPQAVAESVAFLRDLDARMDVKAMDEIRMLLEKGDATKSSRWMREFVFGRQ